MISLPLPALNSFLVFLLLLAAPSMGGQFPRQPERPKPEISSDTRVAQLIQANIMATHAYQVLLAKRSGKGSPACWSPGRLSDKDLESLVAMQQRLLSSNPAAIKDWTEGRKSGFDPGKDLQPILSSPLTVPDDAPVNVIWSDLRKRATAHRNRVRAVANLHQIVLEIDRDGDLLQQVFDFYIALGLPVFLGTMGVDGSDEAFLVAGRGLAPRTCVSPFDTTPEAWQIAGRKIWNWAEKKLHIRDERVIARELLRERDVEPLVPAMRSLPAERIAVIGHSFTMGAHWSSPSSFVRIAAAVLSLSHAAPEIRQFAAGGLTASRAWREFYPDAAAWKPRKVFLVVLMRRDEDYTAIGELAKGFRDAGAECFVFDNIHDPEANEPAMVRRFTEAARAAGITVIEVDRKIAAAPDYGRFLCLDGMHMTEPYHRLMAVEWLRFLVGARPAALP